MKHIFLLAFIFILFSCKKENKKETTPEVSTETVKEEQGNFELAVNGIIEMDDTFRLYYLLGEEKEITKENSISLDIMGSTDPQTMLFKLPIDELPTRLIIKYGNESKSQKIQFENILISFEGSELSIKGDRFIQFFSPNEFITYDRENAIATSTAINGDYKPTFYSRAVLEQKIDAVFY